MVNSRSNPALFALALAGYLLLLGVIAAGFSYITDGAPGGGIVHKVVGTLTRSAHPDGRIVYKVVGVITVVAGIAVFAATVRRWSGYFFAACALAAIKAGFALFAGYTISQPRLVVNRMQAAEMLALLIAMMFLSYRYADRPPRTTLETISLVSAVVGLAGGVALDPNVWPMVGGTILLALPLLVGGQKSKRVAHSSPPLA